MNKDKGYTLKPVECNNEQLIKSVSLFVDGQWVEKWYCDILNCYLDYE